MRMKKTLILTGISLFLTACESVKSTLGMDHYQADEFNIKQNESLEVPPNYKLMPPRAKDKDGKSIPLNASAAKAMKIVGGDNADSSLSEASQKDLQGKVGVADESIRKKIDEEAKEGDADLDSKLASWKKEFIKNARSINSSEENSVEKPSDLKSDEIDNSREYR